ncbi:hypothetical protein INR49_027225 [Caranx melampygus]|nr:hypothetical protein INR49_027225 [Caranx melampygus]
MDVSLGDGVEAAAGQQDDVGLGGFCHGRLRFFCFLCESRAGPVPVLVLCGSVVPSRRFFVAGSRLGSAEREREREGRRGCESAAGGGGSVSPLKRHPPPDGVEDYSCCTSTTTTTTTTTRGRTSLCHRPVGGVTEAKKLCLSIQVSEVK